MTASHNQLGLFFFPTMLSRQTSEKEKQSMKMWSQDLSFVPLESLFQAVTTEWLPWPIETLTTRRRRWCASASVNFILKKLCRGSFCHVSKWCEWRWMNQITGFLDEIYLSWVLVSKAGSCRVLFVRIKHGLFQTQKGKYHVFTHLWFLEKKYVHLCTQK